MRGEIIAIGDELISGRVTNTTSSFAARQLFAAGHEILSMLTIGDDPALIGQVLLQALSRADFVVITGGLGSTTDDLTNEAVARALGLTLETRQELLERFANAPGKLGEKLATLPEGAEILAPESRMAGHVLAHAGVPLFFLPGVPDQMAELLTVKVLPRLNAQKKDGGRHVRQRVFRLFGPGEMEVNARLVVLERQEHVKIGYYPVGPEVQVSLTVETAGADEADRLLEENSRTIDALFAQSLFGHDQETLAAVAGSLVRARGLRLATAESCTGGLIAQKITDLPGSSAWFHGGVVAYANTLKEKLLGVDASLLATHGAVSAETARAMARGLIQRGLGDIGVAVTGIAGPSGGTPEKPVGMVHLALADRETVHHRCIQCRGNRWQVRERAAMTALDMVRRYCQDKN